MEHKLYKCTEQEQILARNIATDFPCFICGSAFNVDVYYGFELVDGGVIMRMYCNSGAFADHFLNISVELNDKKSLHVVDLNLIKRSTDAYKIDDYINRKIYSWNFKSKSFLGPFYKALPWFDPDIKPGSKLLDKLKQIEMLT